MTYVLVLRRLDTGWETPVLRITDTFTTDTTNQAYLWNALIFAWRMAKNTPPYQRSWLQRALQWWDEKGSLTLP